MTLNIPLDFAIGDRVQLPTITTEAQFVNGFNLTYIECAVDGTRMRVSYRIGSDPSSAVGTYYTAEELQPA